ncbi:hypothetical protein [Antrihabitans stalactiti]|uniref:Uncharacterized protein n=1 Tax=Antrihabitans stalactiti TaxID=2584121 RepID=A0A848KC11_9NOCA|nr:hypothetical protein [Antrihabitans stalactiti]NMN95068.1 hypothetical protein [Antrihabitans stalactiti]
MSYLPPPSDPFSNGGSAPPPDWGSSWPPPAPFTSAPFASVPVPATPANRGGYAAADKPPGTIWVAFGLTLAAAVVLLGSGIRWALWIFDLRRYAAGVTDTIPDGEVSGFSAAQVGGWADDAAMSVVIVLAILYILIAAVYVLMAFLAKAGSEAGRIVSTVFAGLSSIFVLGGPISWLIVALGVGAVVCMWLAPSTAYIQVKKIARTGIVPSAYPPPPGPQGTYGYPY